MSNIYTINEIVSMGYFVETIVTGRPRIIYIYKTSDPAAGIGPLLARAKIYHNGLYYMIRHYTIYGNKTPKPSKAFPFEDPSVFCL